MGLTLANQDNDYSLLWALLIDASLVAGVLALGGTLFWLAFRNRPPE